MEMMIRLTGQYKVSAQYGGFEINTDQPIQAGGEGSAPQPFDLFLASIGTCAGFFVAAFCEKRGIPLDGISLVQKMDHNPQTHLVSKVAIEIRVPSTFPAKYLEAVVKAAERCTVKRHLQEPPQFELRTVQAKDA